MEDTNPTPPSDSLSSASSSSASSSSSSSSPSIYIQLGDVVQLDSTGPMYLVVYVDSQHVELVDTSTRKELSLSLQSDETVQRIQIISRNPAEGYAQQHGLIPGVRVAVQFASIPIAIEGTIVEAEEDMIAIQPNTGDSRFYIDFEYKGFPKDGELMDIRIQSYPPPPTMTAPAVPETSQKDPTRIQLGQITIASAAPIQVTVRVDDAHMRYDAQTQSTDLFDSMIQLVSESHRTPAVMKSLQQSVRQFMYMRQMSSRFDPHGNIIGYIRRLATDVPIANYLMEMKNADLTWVMYVGEQRRIKTGMEAINNIAMYMREYAKSPAIPDGPNKYRQLFSNIANAVEYSPPTHATLMRKHVAADMDVLVLPFPAPTIDGGEPKHDVAASKPPSSSYVARYTTGLTAIDIAKTASRHTIISRVPMSENATVHTTSVITFPDVVRQWSRVYLPDTDILSRSMYGQVDLFLWELFALTRHRIPGVNVPLLPEHRSYLKPTGITHYRPQLSDDVIEHLPDENAYYNYLLSVFPRIHPMIRMLRAHISPTALSLVSAVRFFEPFRVYPVNITFMQYRDLRSFVASRIRTRIQALEKSNRAFHQLKQGRRRQLPRQHSCFGKYKLLQLLDTDRESMENIITAYDLTTFLKRGDKKGDIETCLFTPSEILMYMTTVDFIKFYTSTIAMTQFHLIQQEVAELVKSLTDEYSAMAKSGPTDTAKSECRPYTIVKKYNSTEDMIRDNDVEDVYVDKEYARDGRTDTKVKENDYAILLTPPSVQYYVRRNNAWNRAEVDPALFVAQSGVSSDIYCDLQSGCTPRTTTGKCDSVSKRKRELLAEQVRRTLDELETSYSMSKADMHEMLFDTMMSAFDDVYVRQRYMNYMFLRANNAKYDLGQSLDSTAINDRVSTPISPYVPLRDAILAQTDFVSKQRNIIRFCTEYTREPTAPIPVLAEDADADANEDEATPAFNGEENPWWMYCVKTHTPLLPKFYLLLAQAFANLGVKGYTTKVAELIKEIGKKDPNDDVWVDRNSGEPIVSIELAFDFAENQAGFAGEINDDEPDNVDDETPATSAVSPDAMRITDIVRHLGTMMGVAIDPFVEFVVRIVITILPVMVGTAEEYRVKEISAKKLGRALPPFETIRNTALLYLTLGAVFVALQTAIPSIRKHKSFANCAKSFDGFPLKGDGDVSGLTYLACVVKHMDHNTDPWKLVGKKTIEQITAIIKNNIATQLLGVPEVHDRIQRKLAYLSQQGTEASAVPAELQLQRWTEFKPLLVPISPMEWHPLSEEFVRETYKYIQAGDPAQWGNLMAIPANIAEQSLFVQQQIQESVSAQPLLLKSSTTFFSENACCNTATPAITPLMYFTEAHPTIAHAVRSINGLSKWMASLQSASNHSLRSIVNATRPVAQSEAGYSIETVYQAFITYCGFYSIAGLENADLVAVCRSKPAQVLDRAADMASKIASLEKMGKQYTVADFQRLIQVVWRARPIPMAEHVVPDPMHAAIQTVQDTTDEVMLTHLSTFLTRLGRVIAVDERVSKDTADMTKLKNYLQSSIDKMGAEVSAFLAAHGHMDKRGKKGLFMAKLFGDKSEMPYVFKSNFTQFMRTCVVWTGCEMPSMIVNNAQPYIPSFSMNHAKLDETHSDRLYGMMADVYVKYIAPVQPHASVLKPLLGTIINFSSALVSLANHTTLSAPILTPTGASMDMPFDSELCLFAMQFYLLRILTMYIELSDLDQFVVVNTDVSENNAEETADRLTETIIPEYIAELREGSKVFLRKTVAQLLSNYMDIIQLWSDITFTDMEDITHASFQYKEAEKNTITTRLQNATIEERAADTVMKLHRMGQWGRGFEKSFKVYDKSRYVSQEEEASLVHDVATRMFSGLTDDYDDDDVDKDADDDDNDDRRTDREVAREFDIRNIRGEEDDYDEGDDDDYDGDE